jgi:acyl carrier protein
MSGARTVEEVVSRVFGVERLTVDERSSPETVDGWDSMGHLNLLLALEQSFNVSIDLADAMEMANVQKIRQILLGYGVRA